MHKNNQNKGFIKTILLIIIALAILKIVWDLDFLDFLNTPIIQEIWSMIVEFSNLVWDILKKTFAGFRS